MANVPINVNYGVVVGQFIASMGDTSDEGREPDAVPMGGTITFTPSIVSVKNVSIQPNPVTVIKTAVVGVLDEEGFLCNNVIDTSTGLRQRGVPLVATDDPDINPTGWTWTANYNLTLNGVPVAGPGKHSFEVPMGMDTDLTVVSPVSTSTGAPIVRGPSGIITIEHGDVGTVTRPNTDGIVYWVGVARPENAKPLDWWYSV